MACAPLENHAFCMAPLWLSIFNAATSRIMKIAALIIFIMILFLCKALPHEECVVLCVLESKACASCNGSERVFGHMEWNAHLL